MAAAHAERLGGSVGGGSRARWRPPGPAAGSRPTPGRRPCPAAQATPSTGRPGRPGHLGAVGRGRVLRSPPMTEPARAPLVGSVRPDRCGSAKSDVRSQPASVRLSPMATQKAEGVTLDRNLALELMRVTEFAALAAAPLQGRGRKEEADERAVEAMRQSLSSVDMKGVVVIGEGEKDEAPMLYFGEQVGNGLEPEVDVAVDPIDGTEFTANGLPGAMSVVALAQRGTMFTSHIHYMEKLVVGRRARGVIDIDMPVEWNLRRIAKAEGHHPRDLTVIILDRERNRPIIEQVRAVGPRISLISGGDVAAAVAAANDQLTGKHVLMGSGGATEGVLAACAVKCLRGDMQARFYFRDDDERQPVVREGPQ